MIPAGSCWWTDEACDHRVVEVAQEIRARQAERDDELLVAMCLFDDFPALGFTPAQYAVRRVSNRSRLCVNVVRSCCTTVQAEIIQSRPRPMFLTTDGEWSVRRKARKLTQFCEGLFAESQFDRLAARAATDATVSGVGILRGYVEAGRVKFERVYPHEVWVDERDGYYDQPRSIYLTRYVDRDTLKELYPEHKEAISSAASDANGWRWGDVVADQLLVVEAWRLPALPGGKGKHVIAIQGQTVFREDWDHDWTPLLFLRWREPRQGFWPQGLATELEGLQTAINKTLKNIETGQHYNTFPRLAFERSARVVKSHITNEAASGFDFTGTPPIALVFPSVAPEIYSFLNQMISWAYETSGVSQITARAEAPVGLKSGKAIQSHSYLQSRRMLDFQRAFERLHTDAAQLAVRLMEHAANDNKSYEVVYRSRHKVERIAWNDAKLEESSYVIQCFPVSSLPNTPAGRLDAIFEMVNSGFAAQCGIPPQELLRLLDFPDLDQVTRSVSASVDLVEEILESMLDGEYIPPEEFFDLNLCVLIGARAYQRWRLDKVPRETCELLLQWIDEARALNDELKAKAAAAAAPADPLAGGMPAPDDGAPVPPAIAALWPKKTCPEAVLATRPLPPSPRSTPPSRPVLAPTPVPPAPRGLRPSQKRRSSRPSRPSRQRCAWPTPRPAPWRSGKRSSPAPSVS